MLVRLVLFIASAAAGCLPAVAVAEEVALVCHGLNEREGGYGDGRKDVVVTFLFDSKSLKVERLEGVSCWAGKGNCSVLRPTASATQYRWWGGGDVTGSGFATSVELDRRSGALVIKQYRDPMSQAKGSPSGMSETFNLVCQGGPSARF